MEGMPRGDESRSELPVGSGGLVCRIGIALAQPLRFEAAGIDVLAEDEDADQSQQANQQNEAEAEAFVFGQAHKINLNDPWLITRFEICRKSLIFQHYE